MTDKPTPGNAAWDERPMFALDADVTVYWPDVRPCYERRFVTCQVCLLPIEVGGLPHAH